MNVFFITTKKSLNLQHINLIRLLMKIGICNDLAGVEYKNRLMEYLTG